MSTVTNEIFDQWENDWRRRLVGCSIVAEAEIDPADAMKAFWILGVNWIRLADARERMRLARKYRAVLLAGLAATGSEHYDAGTFWDHIWKKIGARGDANRQKELADGFRYGLETLGLSRFTLRSRRHVGEILLHGGVPIHSVGALAKVLSRWDDANPSGDARSFLAWISGSSQQVATSRGIDVPTWLFLTETGDIAEDFVERCLEALDQPDGGNTSAGLPPPVLEEIAQALGGGGASRRGASRVRRAAGGTPAIVFSCQRGVQVRLPPLEAYTESAIEWLVSSEGTRERVESPAPWPGDPIEAKYVSVRAPVKRVVVQVAPSDQTWDLDIIDVDDPLLVFDGDSRNLIAARTPLPRGPVWVAFPNENSAPTSERLKSDGPVEVIETGAVPHGWEGWTFASVDVSNASKIALEGAERWRYVSTIRRPRLLEGARVTHIETRDGRAVLAGAPSLELPGSGGEGTIHWQVSIATADGDTVSTTEHTAAGESIIVDPWGSTATPLLGDFVLSVRGPLGRGATLRAAVADGFTSTASTDFRWMRADGRGLDAAELRLRSPEDGRSDLVLEFDADRWRRSTTLRTPSGALDITAKLPSMSTSAAGLQTRSRSGGPIPLDLEALFGSTLRVDVPPGSPGAQLAAVAGDSVLQVISSSGTGSSRSFALGQLNDTLETWRYAQLRVVVGDRSIPVAYVRPRQLADQLTVSSDGVVALEGAQPVEGLMALAYPRYAPWLRPHRVDFPVGSTESQLPDDVLREGAATFVVSVANPWVPLDAPDLPDWSTRNAFVAEWAPPAEPDEPAERGFRSWLYGQGECPNSSQSLPIALKVYTLIPNVVKRSDVDVLRTALAESVRSSREQVVEALLHSDTDTDDLFRLFVEADVVTVPREDWESSELLWSFSPALGIVADTDEHTGEGRTQFRDNLLKFVGASALEILDDGVDPYGAVGRFGPTERALDPMPQERIDAIMAIANLLPRALLDKDSRAQASKNLFDRRRDRPMDAVIAVSGGLIREAREAIMADFGAAAADPIDARASDNGWMNLPMLSLACAFVARGASRGATASVRTSAKLRKAYMRLAEAAPAIVQQDLGLAELWITRWDEQ